MAEGKNYNGRYPVKPLTVLAEAKCESCGGKVAVKANKNGGAYYYCTNLDENLTMCCEKHCWGQRISFGLRRAFVEVSGSEPFHLKFPLDYAVSEKLMAQLAANDDEQPAQARPRRRNGLFGG